MSVSSQIALCVLLISSVPVLDASTLSLYSTSTAAGLPECSASNPVSVSCNVVSSVLGYGGQPTAGINASMELTGSEFSQHLAGNASVFQTLPPANTPTPFMQTSLFMEATLNFAANSGNWLVSGVNFQGENQQPPVNSPVQVNGQNITSRDERFPTTFVVMHEYGTPLEISVLDNPLIYQNNSGEGLSFSLNFTDLSAVATPEPATGTLVGALLAVALFRPFRIFRKNANW